MRLQRLPSILGATYECVDCGEKCTLSDKDVTMMPKEIYDKFLNLDFDINCKCKQK